MGALFTVILTFATWSSVFSIGKMVLAHTAPLFLTGARMTLAGICLLTFLFFKNRSSFKLTRDQIISFIVLAIFSVYLTNALEFWGLQYLSAAKTCFIYGLSPFFTALFSYIHFKEKMTSQKWLGLLIGFAGFIPVLANETGSEDLMNAIGFLSWPTLAVMGAALCSVYGWIILRMTVKNQETSPLMANGVSMLIGGLFAFTHSFFVESWTPIPVPSGHFLPFLKGTLVMTLLFNLICYNVYGALLKRFTATFLSFVGLLSPIFASLNAWIFLGEPISWVIFLSTGIIGLGLWMVYRAELQQGYFTKPLLEPKG